MKQDQFEQMHVTEWQQISDWMTRHGQVGAKTKSSTNDMDETDFPYRYRRLCQQLALARKRGFSRRLTDQLEHWVQMGHTILYRMPAPRWRQILYFFRVEYPRLVRAEAACVWASALLFFVPLISMIVVLQYQPELANSVYQPAQLAEYESMYQPNSAQAKLGRESGGDLVMFGYYIMNNISIGFRTFAAGLFFGIGSIFVLLSNGVMIGTVAGHLTAIGYGDPFWRFVAGHSAPELMGIVLSGAAGLRLGINLIAPGARTRARALLDAGTIGAKMILGVFVLLLFAAFVEAYWSSIAWMPRNIKFFVGIMLWSFILLWLWRGGRGLEDANRAN